MALIRRTPAALSDLDDIYDYIANDNPSSASKVIRKIEVVAGQLARSPGLGRACDELSTGLRMMPASPYPYVIFYRPIDDGIRIIRVVHGARDFPSLFTDSGSH